MDHQFQLMFKRETRKFLWLMGLSFAVVLLLQSAELPYGNVLSMMFSANKTPFIGYGVDNESSPPIAETIGKMTESNDLKSSSNSTVHGIDSSDIEEDDLLPDKETVAESDAGLNATDEVDDYNNADEQSPSGNLVVVKENIIDDKFDHQLKGGYAPEGAMAPDDRIIPGHNGSSISSSPSPVNVLPSMDSQQNAISPIDNNENIRNHVESIVSNISSVEKESTTSLLKDGNSDQLQGNISHSGEDSTTVSIPRDKRPKNLAPAVPTISDMYNLLVQSRYRSMKPRWSSAVDQELLNAKFRIQNAPILINDPVLYAPLYRNISMFKRSYELMEEMLKVYIYKEGQKPILHQPIVKGIYASEGWFMKQLKSSKKFVTRDPRKAHLFYLPFSSRMLEETLYVPNSHSRRNLVQFLKSYLDLIGGKYPFWNRTGGADHFLVACHDWAPAETNRIMSRCIRSLCNSDVNEGFVFGKDVSLPETFVRNPRNPLREVGGKPPSQRSILAFFAGNMHGYVRPLLLQHWGNNKDPAMKIFGRLPAAKGKMNYAQHMKSSKYCICAKGYEVNSPRVVEAIFFECVPVIISDNFIPPFFEVLNWESFAVFVLEKDIPNLKNILLSIPEKRYRQMQMAVKKVQQHFLWHSRPVKYDIFHMILHSIWYSRVFQVNPR